MRVYRTRVGFGGVVAEPRRLRRERIDPRDYDVEHYVRVLRDNFASRLERAFTPEDYAAVFADPDQLSLFASVDRHDSSDPAMTAPLQHSVRTRSTGARTLLFSSAIGTIIEWYDFFVFASAAALVFDRAFFPRADPRNGVLLALMTYAVGFLDAAARRCAVRRARRPYGRKRALVWSLSLMGLATMSIGLVPGYTKIGVARAGAAGRAPIGAGTRRRRRSRRRAAARRPRACLGRTSRLSSRAGR